MGTITVEYQGYIITTDKTQLQPEAIHKWLSEESYWSKNIPYELVKRAFDNSYCIGILIDNRQIGYGRLITDYTTFAYLADVYVEEEHRGQGLSRKMMEVLMEQAWVQGLRKVMLATLDAHGLYAKFGFTPMVISERYMEISRPIIYGDTQNACK
ncbi:GNAT family N-acetyltransferase [Polluticoccus soli]|uniref:GNAT family N-acetyltransferase n=1 Tax=Polluticoccus soli TaxID=3034150 RepID=UPI0023E11A8B|nr:GNAT family N-acetyltransferase [Flavipsychrobacter sp. JY13-12]